MQQPNRNFTSSSYRYGFQGQEKDDELKGEGNSINYKYRMHDPRVGRFFAIDPLEKKYPNQSTYVFAANSPIQFVDVLGAGPGDKCKGCGKADKKDVGDTFIEDSEHYSITYEVKIDNDVKHWVVKNSELKDSYATLGEEEQKEVLVDFLDKTSYVKVQGAYKDTFTERLKVAFNPAGLDTKYTIDAKEITYFTAAISVFSPWDSGEIIEFAIDNEGFIKIGEGTRIVKASAGNIVKLLGKAKPIWKVARDGTIFKNGSKLQKMVANYFKKFGYYGKNGTPATQLLHEFNTGKKMKHLDKVLGYRKSFLRAIRGSEKYGKLNRVQKKFLIRELKNIQDVLHKITTK